MKILWFANTPCGAVEKINPHIYTGGWLSSLEIELTKNTDIELFICFYSDKAIDSFKYKKTTYYPVHRIGSSTKSGRLIKRMFNIQYDDEKDLVKLLQVIDQVKPDIIHIHGTEENFGLVQLHTKIPVVLSIQGILTPYTEKYFAGIPMINAFLNEGIKPKLKFSSFRTSYNDMKKRALRERKILALTNNVIGRTDWDKRVTRVLAPKSNYYINNEILRSSFYKKYWNKKQFETTLHIVTITSGGAYKGLETIVKTALILKNINGFEFKWTVIGLNESATLPKTVKHWLNINYKSLNIFFVGTKNEQEVSDILVDSDIYCQVSHIENSPNSVCEAMLIGMPIVASFAGGTDTILQNCKEGILVQDGDPYSFAGAIFELLKDFEKAVEYASNAKKRAEERHNSLQIATDLKEIYYNLC